MRIFFLPCLTALAAISCRWVGRSLLGAGILSCVVAKSETKEEVISELRALGNGPARLVWVLSNDPGDLFIQGKSGQLYGLDTEDKKGARCILSEVTSYAKPMLSPSGRRIVFTDLQKRGVYVVDFDGSGLKKLASGYATDVWWDPQAAVEWVYIREEHRQTKGRIVRVRLDTPDVVEPVWTASETGQPSMGYFQLSKDGRQAVDTFPWPQVGIASLGNSDFNVLGKGCWPGISPDSSDRCFYFTGTHKEIRMFDAGAKQARTISLVPVPENVTAFHPRWSNHPRVITVTSPEGRAEAELYAGRFDEEFSRIEKWVRITNNREADSFGDAWFAAGEQPVKSLFSPPLSPQEAPVKERPVRPGLVFRWENERATNALSASTGSGGRFSRASLTGGARPNAWYGADLRSGALVADAEGAVEAVAACGKAGAFSLAFSAQPGEDSDGAHGVIACVLGAGNLPLLLVEQAGRGLFVTIAQAGGASRRFWAGNLTAGQPEHWVLVYADGLLECYHNGHMERSASARPDFVLWQSGGIRFGNLSDGRHSWTGGLEGIELFSRALSPGEAGELHTEAASNWARRPPPSVSKVEAELVVRSAPSDPAKIAPYTRSLVESVWQIRKVMEGTLKERRVIVLQWCVLGGQAVVTPSQAGEVKVMKLEPLEAHPQLSGELRASDLLEPDLPLYFDTGS